MASRPRRPNTSAGNPADHAFDEGVVRVDDETVRQWNQVRNLLTQALGDTTFNTCIKPLELAGLVGDRAVITVPTNFFRDWIVSHFADRIRSTWATVNPAVRSIALQVRAPGPAPAQPTSRTAAPLPATSPLAMPAIRVSESDTQVDLPHDELGARLDPRFTFESFVVGKPNEFAFSAAERIANSNSPPFNPLFLYGGVGLGKTHLMHAIAWQAKQRDPDKRVVYLSAEKFMYQFIRALKSKDTIHFKELFRSVDLLMVDDVQFIGGKDSTQEEFFHTFNALVDRGRQIIISADRSPSDLAGLEERIRSRLSWGLVADIHPTTYELRLGILQAKAEKHDTHVPAKVIEFLAHRITSNVRELEGALHRIIHQASFTSQRAITVEMAQEVLKDVLRAADRKVTIEEIQRSVVEQYTLKQLDMTSACRSRAIARPRQVAMYLAKQLTPRSLPEIGRKFGGRDHTTVMHAIRQVERLMQEDPQFAEEVATIRRRLQH